MHATHSTKLLQPSAKQQAVCSDIWADMPNYYVTSKTTNMRKKYFGCPSNSADFAKFKHEVDTAPQILPDIQSHRTKQVLVPLDDWQNNDYLSISPLQSMGVLHELFKRVKEYNAHNKKKLIQSNPRALTNHGQMLMMQSGYLAYLYRGMVKRKLEENDKATCIELLFNAYDVNVSSNQMCIGHPAITAVGGLVHNIERQTGIDNIKFAYGFTKQSDFKEGKRGSSFKKVGKKVQWRIDHEITGSSEFVLLLRCETKDLDKLYFALKENPNLIKRFCGGSVFDLKIRKLVDNQPLTASYIQQSFPDLTDEKDALDFIVKCYVNTEDEVGKHKHLSDKYSSAFSLNQIGYAYLGTPTKKEYSRNDYPHVWAEPINCIVEQHRFENDLSWWSRRINNGSIIWLSKNT